MPAMAHYIAATPLQERTWGAHTYEAVRALSRLVGVNLGSANVLVSAAFDLHNRNDGANYDTACDKVHQFVVNLEEGTNAAGGQLKQNRQGGLNTNPIMVILGYKEDTLSRLFELLKKKNGKALMKWNPQ